MSHDICVVEITDNLPKEKSDEIGISGTYSSFDWGGHARRNLIDNGWKEEEDGFSAQIDGINFHAKIKTIRMIDDYLLPEADALINECEPEDIEFEQHDLVASI